ncbi:MAG TPA: hypothetical protein VK054_11160, partial [Beutenbergiaceae bacterium]|nr:hypothetical protein [Beutenbergiaceae bacterium]
SPGEGPGEKPAQSPAQTSGKTPGKAPAETPAETRREVHRPDATAAFEPPQDNKDALSSQDSAQESGPPEPTGPVELKANVPVHLPAAVTKATPAVTWHPVQDQESQDNKPEHEQQEHHTTSTTPVEGTSKRSILRWPWRSGASVVLIAVLLAPSVARLVEHEEHVVVSSNSLLSERPIGG